MTEHAGVVREESGISAGLVALDELDARVAQVGMHPDIAGFQDVAHTFDLESSRLAARATLACALERRESRGCLNRSHHPRLDPALQVDLVWSPTTGVARESIARSLDEIARLMHDVSSDGKLVEQHCHAPSRRPVDRVTERRSSRG
jgi:succinate dehydrogenase / fumarate reductase flavoprotein subunit